MESLLHWAITNSDPEKLRKQALTASAGDNKRMTVEELKELAASQARIREAIDAFSEEPTENELMQEAIDIIKSFVEGDGFGAESPQNETEVDSLENTLKGLQILVEPIDNANDLKTMGGIRPLARLLEGPRRLRIGAAKVIGTAASNNPTFQGHLLEEEPAAMGRLLSLVRSPDADESARALYAVAALIRNTEKAQDAFFETGGAEAVGAAMKLATAGGGWKLASRTLQLTADLAAQGSHVRKPLMKDAAILQGVLGVLAEADAPMDVTENAVFALEALAGDSSSKAALKLAGADAALSAAEARLKAAAGVGADADYTEEVVELMARVREDIAAPAREIGSGEL